MTHPTALSDLRTTRGRTGAVLALLYFGLRDSWVAVPALGLLARWSWVRTIGLAALYLSCMAGLFWLVSRGGTTAWANLVRGPGQLLLYIVLIANRRFRGIGPYLLPTCVPAVWVLCEVFLRVGTAAANLPVELIVLTIAVLFLLAAGASVLVGTALSLAFIRLLSRAYAAGAFSDLLYLIGVYWLLALSFDAFAFESWAVMLAIVWLPIVFWSFRGRLRPPPDPPNLLVLRVFRDEHAISALFDSVVDRWRNSGTVYLLAGPDLLLRTLDPQRLFAYVGRRLRRYVISDEAVLATRLADLHERPDPDGRFRVFEFLCVEGAWQPTVDQLLRRADNVLMDLRGLRASNSGSLHELGAIARADHVNRAVLLIDGATDLAAAYDALGTRPPWIVWLESARLDRCEVDGVLELLLHPRVSPPPEWPLPATVTPAAEERTRPRSPRLPPSAGMSRRFAGRLLDWLVVVAAVFLTRFGDPAAIAGVVLLSQILQLHWWGASVGMLMTGQRLVSIQDGKRPTWRQSGMRVGFQALGWCTLGGGSILLGFSPFFDDVPGRRQGWHDRAAGTLVVRRSPRTGRPAAS